MLKISQNLFGDTVVADLKIQATNQIFSHHVSFVITTTHTNVTLDNCPGELSCHVTLKPVLVGQAIHLNGPMIIGGVGHMTPYIRSKLTTIQMYTGCFGVCISLDS